MLGLFGGKCSMCRRKIKPLRQYKDRDGKKARLCPACSEYAERRGFRKEK